MRLSLPWARPWQRCCRRMGKAKRSRCPLRPAGCPRARRRSCVTGRPRRHGWGSTGCPGSICWSYLPSSIRRRFACRRRAAWQRLAGFPSPKTWNQRLWRCGARWSPCWRRWPAAGRIRTPGEWPGRWRRPAGPGACRCSQAWARTWTAPVPGPARRGWTCGAGCPNGRNRRHRRRRAQPRWSLPKRARVSAPCWAAMRNPVPARRTTRRRSPPPSRHPTWKARRWWSWPRPGPGSARPSATSPPQACGRIRTTCPCGCPPLPATCSIRSTASWTGSIPIPGSSRTGWCCARAARTTCAC